jgi:hypothetical protein
MTVRFHMAATRFVVSSLSAAFIVSSTGCGPGGGRTGQAFTPAAPGQTSSGTAPALSRAFRTSSGRLRRVSDTSTPLPFMQLGILWRVWVGNDAMTTGDKNERNNFRSDGQIFYAPQSTVAGTAPFYRLFNGADHMDSPTPGEGGYGTEGYLKSGWTAANAPLGTQEIARVFNGSDHATISGFENPPAGYSNREGFALYANSRYGNLAEGLVSVSGGGVTIESNTVAGGSLWTWTWNGYPFVNHDDMGREIQSSFYIGNQNPTEAGDGYSGSAYAPQDWHGAPVVNLQNTAPNVQVTRSVPLDFFDPASMGGDDSHPISYPGMLLGKVITLNYKNMGPVVDYLSTLTLPQSVSGAWMEMPTGYLGGWLNRFFTFDAATQSLTEVHPYRCPGNPPPSEPYYSFPHDTSQYYSGYGGVIIADSSLSYAMGAYGVSTAVGGPVTSWELWDFTTCNNTSKWSAIRGNKGPLAQNLTFNAGDNGFDVKVMTGSLTQVQGYMRQLYLSP